jgi:hypothetical protein
VYCACVLSDISPLVLEMVVYLDCVLCLVSSLFVVVYCAGVLWLCIVPASLCVYLLYMCVNKPT